MFFRSLVRLLPLTSVLWVTSAHAEISSWFSIAAGASRIESSEGPSHFRFQLPLEAGVGFQPSLRIIPGAGFKMTPIFGEGVDYGPYLRVATQGYVLGGFGAALDGGAYLRSFDNKRGGLMGTLHLGIPWGGVISVNYAYGMGGEQTIGGSIGIDFLRLTVYRLAGEEQWPNVYPAWRP